MTSHHPSRMSLDGLHAVAVGAALMAAAPIGVASAAGGGDSGESGQAANGGGYEPSVTGCAKCERRARPLFA